MSDGLLTPVFREDPDRLSAPVPIQLLPLEKPTLRGTPTPVQTPPRDERAADYAEFHDDSNSFACEMIDCLFACFSSVGDEE